MLVVAPVFTLAKYTTVINRFAFALIMSGISALDANVVFHILRIYKNTVFEIIPFHSALFGHSHVAEKRIERSTYH